MIPFMNLWLGLGRAMMTPPWVSRPRPPEPKVVEPRLFHDSAPPADPDELQLPWRPWLPETENWKPKDQAMPKVDPRWFEGPEPKKRPTLYVVSGEIDR